MSLFEELKRRNVIRVGIAYVVVAWLLLQVADIVLNNVAAPHWVFYAVLLLIGIGFVLVVIFSWAFELTPEGLKRESEVDRSQSITGVTGRKLDRLITGLLVLALAYFAIDKFVLGPQREAAQAPATATATQAAGESAAPAEPAVPDRSIAVLPFIDMSPNHDQEYFSDGLSEELMNVLAKVPELRVAARTSAFFYKGKEVRIDEVGRELHVGHVLEGSVRTAGDRIRVTAQLIKVDDGFHLWSETYDRTLDDVFAIQEQIAAAVADALKVTLLGEARPQVSQTSPEAYALYLQARHFQDQNSQDGLTKAKDLYLQALEIAPDYPAAWVGLAGTYRSMGSNTMMPIWEAYRQSNNAAYRALAIDENFAPALAILGETAVLTNEPAMAASHLRRALELEPANPEIIRQAATLVEVLGRPEEAIRLLQFVVSRDPVNADAWAALGRSCRVTRHWDDAIAAYQQALSLVPNRYGAWQGMGESWLFKGDLDKAMEAYAKEADEEYRAKGLLLVLYQQGKQAEFDTAFAEFRERWGAVWPAEIAHVYAWIGDQDAAFEMLDKSVQKNEEGLYQQFYQPLLASLHDDPRWAALRERTIGGAETLAQIPFEVDLPE